MNSVHGILLTRTRHGYSRTVLEVTPICNRCLFSATDKQEHATDPVWCAQHGETISRPHDLSCLGFRPSTAALELLAKEQRKEDELQAEVAKQMELERQIKGSTPADPNRVPSLGSAPLVVPRGGTGAAPPIPSPSGERIQPLLCGCCASYYVSIAGVDKCTHNHAAWCDGVDYFSIDGIGRAKP
jgi:hypothetical protein